MTPAEGAGAAVDPASVDWSETDSAGPLGSCVGREDRQAQMVKNPTAKLMIMTDTKTSGRRAR